ARVATGRFKFISMWDSFHGASLDAISVGGEAVFRRGIGPLLSGCEHVPPPDPRHCPFRCGADCNLACADYIEYVLEKEGDVAADHALGHYTHEKNPVACAAGLATLQVIEEEKLVDRSRSLGSGALERMRAMAARHRLIGDVRGLGLLMGIELLRDRASGARAIEESERVMYAALRRGLNFKITMGNILALTPALTISPSELDH